MHNELITWGPVLLSKDGLHSVSEVGVEELLVGSGWEDDVTEGLPGEGTFEGWTDADGQ